MDTRKIIIIGVIIVVIAVVTAFMLSSYGTDLGYTNLSILGNGSINENGTLDIKLTDWEGTALKNKDIHVSVKDSEGKIVFDESSKTQVNGVASVELINVSAGEYNINVTFDGDEKYSPSSLSEKLRIGNFEEVEVEEDNSTNDTVGDILSSIFGDDSDQSSQSSPSNQYNGYRPGYSGGSGSGSGSSSNGGGYNGGSSNGGNGGGSDGGSDSGNGGGSDTPSDGGGGSDYTPESGGGEGEGSPSE